MGSQRSPFIGFLRVWLCFSLLWVGLACGNASAQSGEVCGPAPAVKEALDQLPQQTLALTDWQFHEQSAAALQALLLQCPDDVFVQRAYIDFNADENPGLVAPFMKEHQLAFTVIPASNYVWQTLKVFGIPSNWIVDGQGVVRLKGLGYDATEKWVTGMKDAIAKVQSAAPPSNPPAK